MSRDVIITGKVEAYPGSGGRGGDCKIGESFTTNKTVGNLPAGTYIDANDTVASVLVRILKPSASNIKIYFGVNVDIPEGIEGLTQNEKSIADLKNGVTVSLAPALNAYRIMACDKGVKLNEWIDPATGWALSFGTVENDSYNIYYINEPDPSIYDDGRIYDEESRNYIFKFIEEE